MQETTAIENDLPVADLIRKGLQNCPLEKKRLLLGNSSEPEFIQSRVKMFLELLENSLSSGSNIDPKEAELNAYNLCTKDLQG